MTTELEAAQQAIGRLTTQLQLAREETDLSDSTIRECAELLRDDIIEDDVAIDALVLDAIKRVAAERDAARREVERLTAALEEVRRYTLNVAGCAEAYNETESAHLWQEAADIADAALYPPVESPT